MSNLTRKQREIAERHNHFLSIARELLRDEGFHQLSMDKVAELAEYSKGTVYQHFNCKEEMVGQLCINALQRLDALSQRALRYPGSHRERLIAFFVANDLFQQMEQDTVCTMISYHHDQIITKVSPSTRERHAELMNRIFESVKSIVADAMRDGDLPITDTSAEDIVFGFWSLNHGAQALRSNHLPLNDFGIHDPSGAIFTMLQCLLDGLGWAADEKQHHSHSDHVQVIRNTLLQQNATDSVTKAPIASVSNELEEIETVA